MKIPLLLVVLLMFSHSEASTAIDVSNSLRDAFHSTSKERFLVLSFPHGISLPQKMLTVASASILSILSNRTMLINQTEPLLFFDPELSIDDVQLDPQTMNNTLAEPLELLKYLACNLDGPLHDEYSLYLTSSEYFLPALFLNPNAKGRSSRLLPLDGIFMRIVSQLFSFPEQLQQAVEKRYADVVAFFELDEIIGTVIDSPNASNFFYDARLAHRCIIPAYGSQSIVHVISTLPQFNRVLQEHYPRLVFNPTTESEFDLLVELMFQAKYASHLVLYQNSPLSHVIHALANKPAAYLKNSQSAECFAIDKAEPCYPHSLKQFYQVCGEKMGIEFNPHDLIAYPSNIDSCKDAKIGIKVVRPIESN